MKPKILSLIVFLCLFSLGSVFMAFGVESTKGFSPEKTLTFTKKSLRIAMILPLAYDKIPELNFTKFNIEDKKRVKYRSFEYITFYEGARIALDRLEKEGYSVSLYVYDVSEEDSQQMKSLLAKDEMKTMDLIIPLVFNKNFAIAAEFAKDNHIPIVNPMSSNSAIIDDNSFVFKIQPSTIAEVETITRYIKQNHSNPNIILLFTPMERQVMEMYQRAFEREKWTWTGIDYNKYSTRIFEKIDLKKENVYISILDKTNNKTNEAYVNGLLLQLNNKKNLPPINLIGQYGWLDYPSVDLSLLQKFNFHFTLSYLNDYTNLNFVEFVKEYRNHFRQEPDKIYAALGFDIMMYFVPAMQEKGEDFVKDPNIDRSKFMINAFFFDRKDPINGWQNRRTVVYKMSDYKIISVGR